MDSSIVAYLAGFFDGEGSISLNEIRSKVRIRVGQVVEEPLQRYVSMFGGRVYCQQITAGGFPYYSYDTNDSQRCGNILTELYPYLVVKQAKAQVALERLGRSVPTSLLEVPIEYLAGFFDAEGSVSVRRRERNKLTPIVRVKQNDENSVQMFRLTFGGYIHKSMTSAGNTAYEWCLPQNKESVDSFYNEVGKHLLVKRRQVELLVRMCNIRLSNNGRDSRASEKLQLADNILKLNDAKHLKIM